MNTPGLLGLGLQGGVRVCGVGAKSLLILESQVQKRPPLRSLPGSV